MPERDKSPELADAELADAELADAELADAELADAAVDVEGGGIFWLEDPEAMLSRMLPAHEIAPRQWWRRMLGLGPDAATIQQAQVEAAMRVDLHRPVTIAVGQPRGEAGKTVTIIGLGGALASARGGGVLAWDGNEGDSNLLDRLERAHQADVGDLLSAASWFMEPESTMLELERVLQHQPTGWFKALASDGASTAPMNRAQFSAIHQVLRKYFPVVLIDTGNSSRAENWRAAMRAADIIVVPLKLRRDHIVPAARMIRGMQERGESIHGRIVLLISCGPSDRQITGAQTAALFAECGLDQFPVLEVPTDPVIDEEPVIRWTELAPETQASYRALGATVLAMATELQKNETK